MKYVEPLNSASYPERNGGYVDANPATGVKGSTVPAAAIEDPQREIINAILASGLTPDAADLTQLSQVLRTPWEVEADTATRTGDTTITLMGDQRAKYPIGKRLRFNGSDMYLCRVFGTPTYGNGVTAVTVWFDDLTRQTVIPATITKLERSRLVPQDTANGALMVGTDSIAVQDMLMALYCCGGYWSD